MNSSDESAVVELPDDEIERALVEGFGQARWDAMNGAEQHVARDLFGPMAVSIAARVRAEALSGAASVGAMAVANRAVEDAPDDAILTVRDVVRVAVVAASPVVRAEAVADERQRIEQLLAPGDLDEDSPRSDLIRTVAYQMNAGSHDGRAPRVLDAVLREVLDLLATGSAPVATPPTCEAYPRDGRVHSTPATGTAITVHADRVATPEGDAKRTEYVLLTERCTQRECGDRIRYSELTDNQNTHWHVKPGVSLVAVASVATPTEPDGAALIATERRRQVTTEGYTPEHDAECERDGQLAAAAAAYCLPFTMLTMYEPGDGVPSQDQGVWHPACWPWAVRYWKPTPDDRVRELVKAGALIAAEIDRLLAASPVPAVPDDLGSLQRQAIAARARGDFAAERAALDRIIVLERSPVPVEQPEPKGVAGHAPGCDGWRPPTALGFGRSIPERCKPGCPRSEQPETAVYVTPGHPTVAGPGYNCGCGQCLHARRSPAGQLEER